MGKNILYSFGVNIFLYNALLVVISFLQRICHGIVKDLSQ